jgi:hypothetical protein
MKRLPVLLLTVLAGAAGAAPPAPVTPSDPKLAFELVRQLGSPRYRDREKAATELVRMGRAAKPALVEGKKNADPEVQARCEQLLPQALALDLAFRVDRFLTDTEGKLDHDLPLLKTYREKIGTDENARKLYADMLKANGALLEVAEEEPARLTDRVQQRYMEMYTEMFGNPLGGGFRGGYRPGAMSAAELCCVLFASSLPAYKPAQPDWLLANLYSQPLFTNVLKSEKDGTAYRKLFFGYVEARADDNLINQCAWLFTQHRIKDGVDVIARVLQGGKALQVYTKAQSLCCIGTLGGRDHVKVLEPFLADATQVQPFFVGKGQRGEVKVKDVALAMTIHLSGKNPKDYGFAMWNVYPNNLIQYHQLGFASDEERAAAFKKWAEDGAKPAEKKDPPKK